jgi:hypothetical protein
MIETSPTISFLNEATIPRIDPTKEQDYKKQYHYRKRILIVDDEPDITIAFETNVCI